MTSDRASSSSAPGVGPPLAWRTERGFTDTFEAMLTQPLVISYYDQLYAGEGIAAGKPAP